MTTNDKPLTSITNPILDAYRNHNNDPNPHNWLMFLERQREMIDPLTDEHIAHARKVLMRLAFFDCEGCSAMSVPGVIAVSWAESIERCDTCARYPSDEAARLAYLAGQE